VERSVVVTGGSNGIGRGIVARLAQDGFFPINLDIKPPPNDAPGAFVQVDLSNAKAASAVLDEIAGRHQAYGLVNNVGMVKPQTLEDTGLADLDRVIGLNLRTAVLASQKLVPSMRAAGIGRIVNISSRAALGKELRTSYAASKAGLLGLTKTASRSTRSGRARSRPSCSTSPIRPTARARRRSSTVFRYGDWVRRPTSRTPPPSS